MTDSGPKRRSTQSKAAMLWMLVSLSGCLPGWQRLAPQGAGFSLSMPSDVSCSGRSRIARNPPDWSFQSCENTEPGRRRFLFFRPPYVQYYVRWSRVPVTLQAESLESILEFLEAPEKRKTGSLLLQRLDHDWQEKSKEYDVELAKKPGFLAGLPGIEFESFAAKSSPGSIARRLVCLHHGSFYEIGVMGEESAALERVWRQMQETFVLEGGK